MFTPFRNKQRRIGSASNKERYDLPLNSGQGTGFLVQLIALMTFLAVMALAAALALGAMTDRWSSGLENKVTIEIPAERADGTIRTPADIRELGAAAQKRFSGLPFVSSADILPENEIQELISPWLGHDFVLADIPLPGLITLDLHVGGPEIIAEIEKQAAAVSSDIAVDTHESWLGDLLRLTGALQFAAIMVSLIITITTVCAVAGAVRMRMALHHEQIELLHLMGASDEYITRQLQRHALRIGIKGAAAGATAAGMALALIAFWSGDTAAALLPGFSIGLIHILGLLLVPALACGISALTARFTVLRALALMP